MKSWEQRERAQLTLSKEVGYVKKPHGNRLRVALAFPNTYWVGMSNLGFQTIYRLFNAEDDIVCERFFLPPKQELAELSAAKAPLVTLESQTPVSDFDIVAFSVSFEWDYVNVLTLLRLAGIPAYAAERSSHHPLIVVGGAVTFVNPEPLALFADVIAAGEGEVLVPGLRRSVAAATDRAGLLQLLATERGFYIPSLYEPRYADDGTIAGYAVRPGVDAPIPVKKAALKVTDAVDPPATSIFTPDTDRAFSSKSSAAARTSAASVGRATTTCPSARFPPIASCSWRARRAGTRAAWGSCRSRCAITRRSSASSRTSSRWATPSARRRCASTTSRSSSSRP
jgi:hypothetical protein